ncbi:hypothetical protein LHP98_10975 [Rhodobacter sp. Har01]|uniref:hypothetical protein n=1 Tax=Rhodobacter sp. Har01 TaxID=2883999 RepID=UPI001D09176B|nr:hypothetical protein [Rhodobacter sp. Har01]MCB6178650.1 hypothetical protein [Rhodobacter sp. Har01]
MKPNFALNFTDTSISLLHRTAKGWVQVGETPFDAPDLDEALDYLRNTALGMAPGGFSSKLVIPNSQLLYAEIEAPGPSEEERRAQIVAALETRTSLKADEMVFDWSGKGKTVKVVAVDRNTLTEAEAFATQHRFDPVSFVAIPEPGSFTGEPWFGPAGAAAALPADKAAALRDKSTISILDAPKGARKPARASLPEAAAEAQADLTPEEPSPFTPEEPSPTSGPVIGTAMTAAPLADEAPLPPVPPRDIPDAAPSALPEAAPEADAPRVAGNDAWPETEGPRSPPEDLLSSLRAEAGPDAAPQPPAFRASGDDNILPRSDGLPPLVSAPPAAAEVDEAPFAHVTDPMAFPEAEDDIAPPPSTAAVRADARPSVLDAPPETDLPPAPSAAAMMAFASRRAGETEPDSAPRVAPPLGAATRPDAATLARAARGKPVEDLPPMPRPPQAGARPAIPGAKSTALRGPTALVTAPSIPGTRRVKAKPQPQFNVTGSGAALQTAASPADAARSLGRSPFAGRPAQRGRLRHLGLVLTVILLVCLALVAAWSSFYLTSRDPEPAETGVATGTTTPAVEDEMLADGEDPAALATGDDVLALAEPAVDPAAEAETTVEADMEAADGADATPAPLPEPAPETGAGTGDGPVASALLDQQDEIFLAANDAPPPAFDALALPLVDATADNLPAPPMPPPAFGTVYRFDANGLLVPTPDGILSPEGVLLYAGKPPLVPPVRSAVAEAAATEARSAVAPAPDAAAQGTALVEGLPLPAADVETADGAAPAAEAAAEAAPPAAQPNPDLADRRPRARPESLLPANPDDAALDADPATVVTSLRPRGRPVTVLAAGEKARAETAGASLAAPADVGASVTAAAAAAADAANPSLLSISRRPAEKPKDFSRAVEAAVAAAVRMPEPAAAAAPKKKSAAKDDGAAPDLKPEEQDEIDQPEVAASASPKIPTKASVAKQATFTNAINLSKTNLIGVYGTPSKRYALIRLSTGKYKKVKVGDRIDGGTVQAITQSEVRYQKGGRLVTLKMPKG